MSSSGAGYRGLPHYLCHGWRWEEEPSGELPIAHQEEA